MRAAIAELTASNATETDKLDALHRLRDLIRPINNANGACRDVLFYCCDSVAFLPSVDAPKKGC